MLRKICSPQLGIARQSNSGGEVYDREVLKGFCRQNWKVYCLLPKNRDYFKNKNLKVDYAPVKPMFPPYIFNFFVWPYLHKIYEREKFDILRVHSPYFVGPAALLFKIKCPQVPVVASYLHLERKNKLQAFLDKLMINRFDHLITISRYTKKEIINTFFVPEKKITVAYPGVSNIFIHKEKNIYLLNKYNLKNKKIILFLGGLKPRKNPLFLLEVMKSLDLDDAILLIAGEGGLKNKLLQKSRELKIFDKLRFSGFVQEKDKIDYYNLADVVLLPSKKEGFGMIAAEAGACGKPVIVSDNSSLPEVVKNGFTGFTAKTNDTRDWTAKIKKVLQNRKLQLTLGQNAASYVKKNFSWDKNIKLQLQVFENLLKK